MKNTSPLMAGMVVLFAANPIYAQNLIQNAAGYPKATNTVMEVEFQGSLMLDKGISVIDNQVKVRIWKDNNFVTEAFIKLNTDNKSWGPGQFVDGLPSGVKFNVTVEANITDGNKLKRTLITAPTTVTPK
jgi:hypothetical protein